MVVVQPELLQILEVHFYDLHFLPGPYRLIFGLLLAQCQILSLSLSGIFHCTLHMSHDSTPFNQRFKLNQNIIHLFWGLVSVSSENMLYCTEIGTAACI